MDSQKKNRPAFRGRDAAMLGGIAGGLYGTVAPFAVPETVNEEVVRNITFNGDIPIDMKNPAIMASGGFTTLSGATLGALGGAAAYQLLKGLGKGTIAVGKGIGKGIKKLSEKKASKDK